MRDRAWIIGLLAILSGIAILVLSRDAGLATGETMRIVALLGFLSMMVIAWSSFAHARLHLALKQAGSWVLIFFVAFGVFSFHRDVAVFWNELRGVDPALEARQLIITPDQDVSADGRTVSVRSKEDGHFWVTANASGRSVKMMVDTGATSVALTLDDAEKLGFRERDLEFTIPVQTAGGQQFGAAVRIDSLAIGPIQQRRVDAIVMREGLPHSLLGMSWLRQLSSWSVQGETLRLVR